MKMMKKPKKPGMSMPQSSPAPTPAAVPPAAPTPAPAAVPVPAPAREPVAAAPAVLAPTAHATAPASDSRPRVHVSFLIYSPVPARRTVALTVEGGNLAMLHEGESTGGVEVARIFPDHVQLRHAGETFTVRARD